MYDNISFSGVYHLFVTFYCGHGGWEFRALDCQLRAPRFQSTCCCFKAWAISFTPDYSSSFGCINEHLHVARGGYKLKNSLRTVIVARLNAFQKSLIFEMVLE